MTNEKKKYYAAYNGTFFIWTLYGSDGDCMTSYAPSIFEGEDGKECVKRLIQKNGDQSFYCVEVTNTGRLVKALTDEEKTVLEMTAAKDHIERGIALLKSSGRVIAEDFESLRDQLTDEIVALQCPKKEAA